MYIQDKREDNHPRPTQGLPLPLPLPSPSPSSLSRPDRGCLPSRVFTKTEEHTLVNLTILSSEYLSLLARAIRSRAPLGGDSRTARRLAIIFDRHTLVLSVDI